MPNNCNWHVIIYWLSKERKDRVGRRAKNGELCKQIIPYPKEVKEDLEMEQKCHSEENKLRERWWNKEEYEKIKEKYPYKQLWYDWEYANRWTKWGLCDCSVHNNEHSLELIFWTARSPLLPVFKRLSEKYKCIVEYDYDEPWNCFSGRVKWENWVEVYDDRFDDWYYGEWVECVKCHWIYDWANEDDWADMENHICFNCWEEEDEEH